MNKFFRNLVLFGSIGVATVSTSVAVNLGLANNSLKNDNVETEKNEQVPEVNQDFTGVLDDLQNTITDTDLITASYVVDGKIWKGDLYIKEGEDYYNLYELIDVDKNSLYIKIGDSYILYIDFAKPNIYFKDFYVEDDENYQLLDNLDNNLKEIYLNKEGIQSERIVRKRDYSGNIARYNSDYQLYPIAYSRQYYEYETDAQSEKAYWTIYLNTPEMLNFWFDFLDLNGELDQYSVKAIGNRTKAVNDSSVKAIYFRETPTILFTDDIRNEEVKFKPGYTYIQVPKDMFNALFSLSSQGKSAMDVVTENLYNYAYCQENITINSVPIYYLEQYLL